MGNRQLTWSQWLERHEGAGELISVSEGLGGSPWQPTDRDRAAAWILYTELRTRITTQPLHYRSGDEETALDSLYKLFDLTRRTIEEQGAECRHLALIAIHVLNRHVRPLTAKWHKWKVAGRLLNDDDRRQFRRELQVVQGRLVDYCRLLGSLAEGDAYLGDDPCGLPLKQGDDKSASIGPTIPFDRILFDGVVAGSKELCEAELREIRERRRTAALAEADAPVTNLVGLACSGGGIRSATFCLGVVQALARRGLLPRVDYLSTVSGGGYFGAFLSSYLNDGDNTAVGLEPGQLPFAESGPAEPTPIRQLRNNSKYLVKGGLLGQSRVAGLLLFGILVNLLTLLPALLLALTLTKAAALAGTTAAGFHATVGVFLGGLLVSLAVAVIGLPLVYRWWKAEPRWIARYERISIGVALAAVGVWALGWALPWLYGHLVAWLGAPGRVVALFVTLPLLLAGAAGLLGLASALGRVLVGLAGLAGPLLLLMTYLALSHSVPTAWPWVLGLLAVSGLSIAWLWVINVNQISPHRYYRNRLAETYLLRRGKACAFDPQPLSALRTRNPRAPYHLINAAVNLPASKAHDLRGRSSDFFLFSQGFCGSPLLGYRHTVELERKDPSLDLGTSMAISGAAASAYMGTATVGGLAFWLALLNVRLGYWLPNPKRLAELPDGLGPRPFSLWRELFGGIDEQGQFVNVSDGGHIENLGIYELLRRRCKLIIAIDGEADPAMTLPSLMRLIRYAQIDFGIHIRMGLGDLARNEAGFTKAHFVLGEIDYGEAGVGYLLYIKSSLTGNEREYILEYRAGHPSFPHETTADQFFDEAQFEAYRALGEHIGEDLFQPELIGKADRPPLEAWLAALVRNLLEERIA